MKKIILITNIPTPYRIPLFNELNIQMQQEGMELYVLFSESGYRRRKFEIDFGQFAFKYSILGGGTVHSRENTEKTYFFYKGLWKKLTIEKPSKIIVAGFSTATMITSLWCKIHNVPFTIWSGSIETEKRNNSFLRKFIRKQLIKSASTFVAYGTLAKEYLIKMGAHPENTFIGINTVDTQFYRDKTNDAREVTSKNRIFTFTYLGYLVPRKNVGQVLRAAALLYEKRKDFMIQIIGDGESKNFLLQETERLGLQQNIVFTGYKQKNELPSYFAHSNAFLFQSDFDIWGLVLNEAMASGLCCLATVNAGATEDLIEEDKNGFAVDFNHVEEVANKMNWMLDHPNEVNQLGKKAAEDILEKASLAVSAKGFILALK